MEIAEFTDIMKALSDNNRVRILLCLKDGELCVCQILEFLDIAPSTLSKHISILKNAALIQSRKSGRWKYYRLSDKYCKSVTDLVETAIFALKSDVQIQSDLIKLKSIKKCNREDLCKKQRGVECCGD